MKKINVVLNGLLALGICLSMMSCGSASERFLSKFDKFVSSVVEKGDQMSEEEWDEAQAEHEEFMMQYNDLRGDFTAEENQEFGRLQGEFAKAAMSKAYDMMGESLKDGAEMMEGYLDGLMGE